MLKSLSDTIKFILYVLGHRNIERRKGGGANGLARWSFALDSFPVSEVCVPMAAVKGGIMLTLLDSG